jgi:hypothetical protein
MSADGITDVDAGVQYFLADERQITGWEGLLAALNDLDVLVLEALNRGLPPHGKQTSTFLAENGLDRITAGKIRASIDKLRRVGILSKSNGSVTFDDPLLAEYLARKGGYASAGFVYV